MIDTSSIEIEKEAVNEKNMLLKKVDSAILSTVGIDGLPNASYAPVAYDDDNNIYIY